MQQYTEYPTWQEQDGKLVPVCEKPLLGYNPYYKEKVAAYNESLKISLPIIGGINTIKGRKDLKIDVDFKVEKGLFLKETGHFVGLSSKAFGYNNLGYEEKNCAVLIDNKQKETPVVIWGESLRQQKEDVPNTDAEKKAKELVQKYYQPLTIHLNINNNNNEMWEYAKSCALIAVDEILNMENWRKPFWNQVREAISKL